jgi:hypothetical protein
MGILFSRSSLSGPVRRRRELAFSRQVHRRRAFANLAEVQTRQKFLLQKTFALFLVWQRVQTLVWQTSKLSLSRLAGIQPLLQFLLQKTLASILV